jgi:hypothetical protein
VCTLYKLTGLLAWLKRSFTCALKIETNSGFWIIGR